MLSRTTHLTPNYEALLRFFLPRSAPLSPFEVWCKLYSNIHHGDSCIHGRKTARPGYCYASTNYWNQVDFLASCDSSSVFDRPNNGTVLLLNAFHPTDQTTTQSTAKIKLTEQKSRLNHWEKSKDRETHVHSSESVHRWSSMSPKWHPRLRGKSPSIWKFEHLFQQFIARAKFS